MAANKWLDLTPPPQDTTPLAWENNLRFWQELYEVISTDAPTPRFHNMYGELAALGIEKGKPFDPDWRMVGILERAARTGNAQMRVESFADRRPDSIVWPDRKWEWAALRFEDGDFNAPNYADLYARDKWFYQAIGASPAMFKRDTTAGSLYWLGTARQQRHTTRRRQDLQADGAAARSRTSSSGRSRFTTPAPAARSRPIRARPRCAPCSS